MYPEDAEVTDLAFSSDGKFLYYHFDSALADTSGARAVDISVDPLGRQRRPRRPWVLLDRRHRRASPYPSTASPAASASTTGRREGTLNEWELFAVDTDGPMPSTPIKIARPVAAGGGFDNVGFGPDPALVYTMPLDPPGSST